MSWQTAVAPTPKHAAMHPRQTALAVGLCAHDGTQLFAITIQSARELCMSMAPPTACPVGTAAAGAANGADSWQPHKVRALHAEYAQSASGTTDILHSVARKQDNN